MSVPKHLRLEPGVEQSRVRAASGELAALVATPAAGRPPRGEVLLVPGYTGSKEDFIHLLPLLAGTGYRASAIDLRGQFQSGGPEDERAYSITSLAADVASLVADGSTPGATHLVGHSFGGLICRDAVISGANVRSLTLLCSGPAALGGNRGALIEMMRPLLADGGVPAVWEASSALPSEPDMPAEVQDFLKRRFLASPAAALLGMGEALTGAVDRVDELAASGVPILVACGENDDAWSPSEQREMAARLGAEYVEFRGAGHSPAVDDPAAVAAALERFWSS